MMCFENGGKGPLAKECRWPLEIGKVKDMDSLLELHKGMQPANSLILAK